MLLLEKVFEIINASGLEYCIQNKYEMMPEVIPSDIDMMYKDASEEFLDNLVRKIAKETGLIITQKICQGYYEFTYIISYPCPKEYFQLQLDFYRAISRRGYLNIMPAEEMIKNRRFYKCFYVPDPYVELKYMWIRRTIKHDLNLEHIQIAKKLYSANREEYRKNLIRDFGEDTVEVIDEIIEKEDTEIFYKNFSVFDKRAKSISKANSPLSIWVKYILFMIRTVIPKRVFHKCGMSVAFLSPDGGGKSTVIGRISETVSGSFYGVDLLYMRPRFLKNAGHYNIVNPTEEALTNTDPHNVQLDSPMKSFVRFMFYNLDYIVGTVVKINKKKINKRLVIFDRYYYDYYADMKRYKYNLPKWMPSMFEWMIPCPDMVFVLDGSAECLYERKQELTIDEISAQREAFRKLSETKNNFYIINVEREIDSIVDEVTSLILQKAQDRTKKLLK